MKVVFEIIEKKVGMIDKVLWLDLLSESLSIEVEDKVDGESYIKYCIDTQENLKNTYGFICDNYGDVYKNVSVSFSG